MEIKIGNSLISKNKPAFIIAELSANHNQNYNLAVKTIEAMKKAGANAVKFQTYTPDTITINSSEKFFKIKGTIWNGQNLYKLYKKAYMPWEWQPKLKKIVNKLGMECFSSPFDNSAVDFLEKMKVPAYKVASYEITDIPLITYIAKRSKPIIISTGIAKLSDIQEAIRACQKVGNNQIALLKCTSGYPAPFGEINLRTIPYFIKHFKVITGLSDHTLGISVPIASVTLGAKIIEKHFILDRKLGGVDSSFSLEPKEFKQMVQSIREVEKALGEASYQLTKSAKKNREFARSLFVVNNIKKDELFSKNNIRSIRPGFGLPPKYLSRILGKKAKKDLVKGTPLSWQHIK